MTGNNNLMSLFLAISFICLSISNGSLIMLAKRNVHNNFSFALLSLFFILTILSFAVNVIDIHMPYKVMFSGFTEPRLIVGLILFILFHQYYVAGENKSSKA